jgi:arylsulfatase A-like enzyme
MTPREWATSVCRDAVLALGVGFGAALPVAAARGWQAAAPEGWWAAGYHRLVFDAVWARFDVWGPAAAGAVLALLAVLRGARRGVALPGLRRAALVAALLVGGVRGAAALQAWRTSPGPNLLLISIDTLRADRLGAYGYELPTSPTVDRLAAAGTTFEQAFSQSPKTTPSHMTMLTSLYPSVHGVELWEDGGEGHVLNPAVMTLAEVLANAGYATAAFTGGANMHGSRGFDQGFQVYKHSRQLERARRWLGEHRRRKFFLFFHTYAVHDPYLSPPARIQAFAPDYQGPIRDAVERVRAGVGGWDAAHRLFWRSVDATRPEDVRFVARLYDAAIREMDEALLAPLLERLESLGLARDTLVVFTSDHGEAFGEHGAFLHDDLYAGTLHVPLVLRFPGRIPEGRRVTTRVRTLDLMPTVLALLGVPAPAGLQGESLVPLIGGGTAGPAAAISEYSNARLHRTFESVREGRLAYIADGPAEQLFDLATDPGEQTNLAAERPQAVEAMRTELARWHEASAPLAARLGPAGAVAPDAATARQLRALGYVE